MIDFQGKDQFRAIFDRIEAAGHFAVLRDNEWQVSDVAAVQNIVDGFGLVDAREAVVAAIEVKAREHFDKAVAGISPAEMAAWPILRAEAAAYQLSGNESDAPNVVAEASARRVPVYELVQRILNNAAGFEYMRAQIAGVSGRHKDAVRNLNTFAEIAAYDFSGDWPGV